MSTRWEFTEGASITPELTAIRLLGGGATYEAYLATDDITYAPVVVKIVRPHRVDDESALRGLRREIEALEAVRHPSVVRALRHETDSDRPHIVLENFDGPKLSTLIRRHGKLQPQQYLPLGMEVAAALHYFTHIGRVHLDIKPSNIIMGAPAKLIDLSVMRTSEVAAGLAHPVGTDAFMAPEQAAPCATNAPTSASDVWALGATLFNAIAAERAFSEPDPDSDEVGVQFPQVVEPARTLPRDVDDDVVAVVHAALAHDPAQRPSPARMVEVFGAALERQPVGRLSSSLRKAL